MTGPRPFATLAWLLLTLVLVTGLGAGAIALERPAGLAKGRVTDAFGKPLANARVVASGPVTRTLYSREDGSFAFHHLPVGEYYVSADAKGHDQQSQESAVQVAEGKTVAGVDFELARTTPSTDIANYQRVFTPAETVRVNVRGNQLDALDVTLYRLDVEQLAGRDPELKSISEMAPAGWADASFATEVKRWQVPIATQNREDEDWFYQPVQVDGAAPGAYAIVIGGQPGAGTDGKARDYVRDAWWFTISRTAIVTKRAGGELLAWVTDLEAKKPVAGATVKLFAAKRAVQRGTTDASGLTRFQVPVGLDNVLALATHQGSPAIARAGHYEDQNDYHVYAYTDRPVYRPGHKVRFKAVVRRLAVDKFVAASARTASVTVKDALGAEVFVRDYPLSDASAFDGDFDLPAEAPLGEYRAEIKIANDYDYIDFKVADYRKPEYKVDVTPAKPRFVVGETAEVGLLAGYYFGAPVPGAKMQVTVYSAHAWGGSNGDEGFYGGFIEDPEYTPSWGFGDVVQQEEAVADAQGRARVRVPLARPTGEGADTWEGDRVFTVEVEAMDASGRPVKAHESFLVAQADVKLRMDADQALYADGAGLGVSIATADYDGKPVSTDVGVTVVRLESETRTTAEGDEYTETKRVPVYTGSIRTDARGMGKLAIPAPGEGSFEIIGEVRDAGGRTAKDLAWTWVASGDEGGGSYRYGAVQVILDKRVYKPGERAKALVVSPVQGATVLVTVEGTRLHESRVVTLKGSSGLVELPIREAYKPNAFVAASIVNGKEFLNAEVSLNVMPADKFLQVAVSTPKGRVEPGETVLYKVQTKDWQGKPVDAEVSLGVVDEAIYAIEPDHTPDIRGFFHGPRWNRVSTAYSFAEDYSGGLDKFAPDPRVRARFEDTAAWFPNLRTGADGQVEVSVHLPDNLTTWIAAARAATRDTRVGTARHNLIAAKDLLVRLETPRFVVAGDHVVVSAIAHNYTEAEQRVALDLTTTGAIAGTFERRSAALPPGGSERVAWEVEVSGEGPAKALVMARPEGAPGRGDAMELPFPALGFGVADYAAFAAVAAPDRPGEAEVEVPAGSLAGAKVEARLHVTPLPSIAAAIGYLHQYKYGCVEQTMSRFLPDAALEPRLRAAGVPTAKLFPEQAARMDDGVRRLLGFQQGDGGWGWWGHDETKPELTAYVTYGLAEARRAGVTVPAEPVKRALERLKRALPGIKKHVFTRSTAKRGAGADARAFILFAISRWETPPAREVERLYADRADLSPYGAAQLAMTLAAADDPRAGRLADALRASAEQTELTANWAGADEAFAWHDSRTEATAWALRALLATAPDDPLVPKAVRWLESKNADGYWEHTKATAAAAIALADYLAVRKPPSPEGFAATVYVDDQVAGTYDPGAGDLFAVPPPITAAVAPGRHRVRVEVAGTGETVDVTGGASFRRSAEGLAAASAHGLTVERRYLNLPADVYATARGKGPGGFYDDKVAAGLKPLGEETKAGDRVLVQLTVKTEREVRWMCVADPLPAGCEILEDQPANWSYWWDHQEYRDEEAAFFFDELGPGTRTLYYVMRPTTPGRFRVLPTTAWAMYAPEVRARGTPLALTIKE